MPPPTREHVGTGGRLIAAPTARDGRFSLSPEMRSSQPHFRLFAEKRPGNAGERCLFLVYFLVAFFTKEW